LQNRVPRVQVLLPLPKQKDTFTVSFLFWQDIIFTEARACRASSPKRTRWVMKRGEDGAAVKICRRSKPKQILGTARGHSLTFCPFSTCPIFCKKSNNFNPYSII
ncbi:MAG: hypothetical protein ACI4IG_05270, partial [Eubacterium sp.]